MTTSVLDSLIKNFALSGDAEEALRSVLEYARAIDTERLAERLMADNVRPDNAEARERGIADARDDLIKKTKAAAAAAWLLKARISAGLDETHAARVRGWR